MNLSFTLCPKCSQAALRVSILGEDDTWQAACHCGYRWGAKGTTQYHSQGPIEKPYSLLSVICGIGLFWQHKEREAYRGY